MTPTWITALLDLPAERYDGTVSFWQGVTGYHRDDCWCGREEFETLAAPDGDGFLRVQRLGAGEPGVHLDLHVDDPRAAAAELTGLGARVVVDRELPVMASPHGLVFCLVVEPASRRPAPHAWPGGHTSLVDQVCLDIPPSAYAEECAFWQAATGWELRHHGNSEFSNLARPAGQPLRLLLQRRDEGEDPVTAHLDMATTDREAEVARHQELGATVASRHQHFTVLQDVAGSPYCVTDRDPQTGMLW